MVARLRKAFSVALIVLFAFASWAAAQPFGSGLFQTNPESGYWLANGPGHRVDLHNTTTNVGAAIQWAMVNALDNPTVMNVTLWDGENYDVRVVDADYGPSFPAAWVSCPPGGDSGAHPNKTCYGQKLHWNLNEGYEGTNDTLHERRSRACHELGHTVGLGHAPWDADSCMAFALPANRPKTYSNHDINQHINPHYG